jgi:nitrilase
MVSIVLYRTLEGITADLLTNSAGVYGPDGRELTTPLPNDQEGIQYATVDYNYTHASKLLADCVGHYSRPDLLR